ncbi:H-NS histone family protein [Brucella cytisi]|uniref:KorB protein n=1 Tax=Brucella cytisi TaxID=407152 RepID=A0A1J6HCJ1_9HYPH|nr:H-NS histone family protein [Brucella cytisi]OIS90305.1 KorB protein [Brucella cytisi]
MKSLQDMTDDELKEQRQAIESELQKRLAKQKSEAKRQIVELAKNHNIDLGELAGKEKVYKNPENPWETWSGKGRKPKWVTDALEQGKTLDDLAAS